MVHFINQIIYNIQTLGLDFIKSSIVSQIHPCPLNRYLGHGRIFGASLPVSEFPLMLFQKWNLQIILHENENETNWPLSSLFLKYPLMSATPAWTHNSIPPTVEASKNFFTLSVQIHFHSIILQCFCKFHFEGTNSLSMCIFADTPCNNLYDSANLLIFFLLPSTFSYSI